VIVLPLLPDMCPQFHRIQILYPVGPRGPSAGVN